MENEQDKLINDLMVRLSNKLCDSDIQLVCNELRLSLENYVVSRQVTELAVVDQLPECYKAYIVAKKIEGRSPGTLNLYRIVIEDMLRALKMPLEQITSNTIRVYLYRLQKARQISDRTLDCRRTIIKSFFTWLTEEKYIPSNPCIAIKPIHYEVKPCQPLNDIQMERIRRACQSERDIAIVETLYATGCRCSELSNLLISDIDFESREVKLFGKGKKHRVSFLTARAVVAIEKYLETRSDGSPYLFVSLRAPHSNLGPGGIEGVLAKVARAATVDRVYPHRIRHTFATDALDRGMKIQDLQSILGHSSIDTTLIYAKINPQQVKYNHRRFVV